MRDHAELVALLGGLPQKGVLFPLVGARRAGKTWELKALEHLLAGSHGGEVRYVDMRRHGPDFSKVPDARCLLLDEPELSGTGARVRPVEGFLSWCEERHHGGTTLLLAMSPAEWVVLQREGESRGLVSAKDLRFLAPLQPAQAERMAARTELSRKLLPRLPDIWKRSPFLLELAFQVAEELGAQAEEDVWELLRLIRERSDDAEFHYFEAVYRNGLTEAQRAVLNDVATHADPSDKKELDLLVRCGLVGKDGSRPVLADPILAADLLPLRFHHISDLHFGPKSAERVDVKDSGAHARRMAAGLGPKHVRDEYLRYVASLKAMGRAPHVLIVSGDLVEWGDDAQFEEARGWLEKVLAHLEEHPRLRPDEPHLLLAGGNHDVDWRQTDGDAGARKRHVPFARAFNSLPRSLRVRLEEAPESRPLAIARYPELGVEILLLGSAEFGGEQEKDPAREGLLELVERLRREAMAKPEHERAEALHQQVARIDPGLVHGEDLAKVRREPWSQPVRLAVLHHPVSPLPMTELGRYVGLINAGEVKDRLMEKGFCLVLHGHAHTGWFGKEAWPGRHGEQVLWIASAPSLGSREVQEHHGFNEIVLSREPHGSETTYSLTVRRYSREGGSWVERSRMDCLPGAV
ncbi:MAG TPA: metallophosphoesterase [Archangium sp.]|nr:metallophosphoesterase [Archangium sp.]